MASKCGSNVARSCDSILANSRGFIATLKPESV